jgi:hypothetical protein
MWIWICFYLLQHLLSLSCCWLCGCLKMSNKDDAKVWDLFNGSDRSPEELAESRLEICKGCEWFRKNTQTCKKCGCFMKLKTLIDKASCPVGKW